MGLMGWLAQYREASWLKAYNWAVRELTSGRMTEDEVMLQADYAIEGENPFDLGAMQAVHNLGDQ